MIPIRHKTLGFKGIFDLVPVSRILGDLKPDAPLLKNIKQHGIIEPVSLIVLDHDNYDPEDEHQLLLVIAGRRRVGCFKKLGYPKIPAVVHEGLDRRTQIIRALSENLVRKPNAVCEAELARSWALLGDDPDTMQEVLCIYKRDAKKLADFLNITEAVFEAMKAGDISPTCARVLSRLPREKQDAFLKRDKLTVAAAHEYVKETMLEGQMDFLNIDLPEIKLELPKKNPMKEVA